MIDRGFIKWQPFESVLNSKEVIKELEQKEDKKPILFPEELEILNEQIKEAYFSQNKIILTFYSQNKIQNLETYIYKIFPTTNLLEIKNHQIISFKQIIHIKNCYPE